MNHLPTDVLLHNIFRFFSIADKQNIKLACYDFYSTISQSTNYLFLITPPSFLSIPEIDLKIPWNYINSTKGRIGKPNLIGFTITNANDFARFLTSISDVSSLPCKLLKWQSVAEYPNENAHEYLSRVESIFITENEHHLFELLEKCIETPKLKTLKCTQQDDIHISKLKQIISPEHLEIHCKKIYSWYFPGLGFPIWTPYQTTWKQLRILKLTNFSESRLVFSELYQLEHLRLSDFACTFLHLEECNNLKSVYICSSAVGYLRGTTLSILIEDCSISTILQISGDNIQKIAMDRCSEIKRIRMNRMNQLEIVKMEISVLKSLHWQQCEAVKSISLRIRRLVSLFSDHYLLSMLIKLNYSHLLSDLKSFGYNITNSMEGIQIDSVLKNLSMNQLFKFAIFARESYLKRTNWISEDLMSQMMLQMDRMEYLDLENITELENKHIKALIQQPQSKLKQIKMVSCRNVDPNVLIPFVKRSSSLRRVIIGTTKYDISELKKSCLDKGIRYK